jgi:glycosyltransferase involved in cell wall biosynthesis
LTRRDVGIYTTSAATAGLYDRSHGRAGGAERQMTLLARSLAARGRRVAHVVYPPRDPISLPVGLTLVHRPPYARRRRLAGSLAEARTVWRALRDADAAVVIFRSASPAVGVGALFCRVRRRAFVFSSSNISDFTVQIAGRSNRMIYRLGVRLADAVVVQSDDQIALAHEAFGSLRRVVRIPSFAESLEPAGGAGGPRDTFVWLGRAVPQKQPLRYVELAQAVPEAQFIMIPVPDGPSRPVLEALTAEAQRVPNLTILEPLQHAELPSLFGRAVAVVNTSTLEGMPNTFLEAWSCGIPVLTLEFDPDGVVVRERLGIAAGGSWDAFVAGARELWESRFARTDVRARVQTYVRRNHSLDAVGARWDALIGELTRRRV